VILLWLCDTLQDVLRHVVAIGTFRESNRPCKYPGYVVAMSTIIQVKPPTFEEVVKEQVWKDVMAKEYESIMRNDVWDVVLRPKGKYFLTSKWLFKIKHGDDEWFEKYKARFMAKCFSQKEGEDYDDIFGPISRYTTIYHVVPLAKIQGWTLHQMDVNNTFLHGIIQEEVFIEKPLGFELQYR